MKLLATYRRESDPTVPEYRAPVLEGYGHLNGQPSSRRYSKAREPSKAEGGGFRLRLGWIGECTLGYGSPYIGLGADRELSEQRTGILSLSVKSSSPPQEEMGSGDLAASVAWNAPLNGLKSAIKIAIQ
ncbi:hypothetical protein CEP52_003826 [Fusarium oligoseptatum]|uniref:Uncharacterized protein n=1 Tax=Fusarium oligoseptatum TaxID=2604345 RepID=A0A428U6I4_9HYPO|nr:hypothetical protein CEP52_003826 [Fusarium oligoseptatum]